MPSQYETVRFILRIIGVIFLIPGAILVLVAWNSGDFNLVLVGAAFLLVGVGLGVAIPHGHSREGPHIEAALRDHINRSPPAVPYYPPARQDDRPPERREK